jgi:S-(hydroxymethyl)glutathione dehydrogenase/alcohol dehydrogenase
MKAAILYKTGQPLIVDEVKLPDNLEFGQVLIKLYYSGICGAQINEIDAIKGEDNYLPHLLGHEGSGIVENIGPAVSTVKVGDHVVLHWRPSNGIQSNPPSYLWNNKKLNAGWVTTFNDKAVISENRLTVIPKDFDVALAPLFGCAITTAFGVINNDANLKIGQSVIVIGLGGVGLNIVQASNLVSANPIIGVDINKNKVIKAKNFGLDYGYNGLNANNI